MKKIMSPIRCIACHRDPTPITGKYGKNGNKSMICMYCRARVKYCIKAKNDIDTIIHNIIQERISGKYD